VIAPPLVSNNLTTPELFSAWMRRHQQSVQRSTTNLETATFFGAPKNADAK
jgi:hypothetical protein